MYFFNCKRNNLISPTVSLCITEIGLERIVLHGDKLQKIKFVNVEDYSVAFHTFPNITVKH